MRQPDNTQGRRSGMKPVSIMHVADILVRLRSGHVTEVCDALHGFLNALWRNGQILGTEWPIARVGKELRVSVIMAERGALATRHQNGCVRDALQNLTAIAGARPRVRVLGSLPGGSKPDRCARPSCYVLFTTYLAVDSSLTCGDCFCSVPLYRIPHTDTRDYQDILCWQSDYRACDHLQMTCTTGERFGTREMSRADSSLSKQGRAVCEKIAELTGKPTYYYLYRGRGRSRTRELKRPCPGCGGPWLLPECWHLFDFRCDRCWLVSNIAWDAG